MINLLLTPLLFLTCSYGSPQDEIRWSEERSLAYSDFSGDIPSASPWAATTNSNIYFSYDFTNHELEEVIVYSFFSPSRSWMRNKIPSVLEHEQLHFDITELFARRLYKECSTLLGTSVSPEKLKALFKNVNSECSEMQSQYDEESNHGVYEAKQVAWEKKIHDLLKNAPAYPSR